MVFGGGLALLMGCLVYFLILARNEVSLLRISNGAKEFFLKYLSNDLRYRLQRSEEHMKQLASDKLEEKQKRAIFHMHHSHRMVHKIVDGIHFLFHLDKEDFQPNLEMTNMKRLMSEILDIYPPLAREKGIALEFNCFQFFPNGVWIDPRLTRYIVAELIGHAVKHTAKGKVTVTLSFVKKDPSHGDVVIEVKDTGVGIPIQDIHHLFDSSNDPTLANPSGLGLYIVSRMVDKMGGKITVQSHERRGTQFTVVLPALLGGTLPASHRRGSDVWQKV
jgi:two-component system capsular synthesis sensor histidine kinase RcsC